MGIVWLLFHLDLMKLPSVRIGTQMFYFKLFCSQDLDNNSQASNWYIFCSNCFISTGFVRFFLLYFFPCNAQQQFRSSCEKKIRHDVWIEEVDCIKTMIHFLEIGLECNVIKIFLSLSTFRSRYVVSEECNGKDWMTWQRQGVLLAEMTP